MAGRPIVIDAPVLPDVSDKIKYSHAEDCMIGEPRERGMTHTEEKSKYTKKDKAENGLVLRQSI